MTHRELAALIALAFWLFVVAIALRRSEPPRSLLGVVRGGLAAVAKPIVMVPMAAYLCWMAAALMLAEVVGLWDVRLLKQAALWWVMSGVGLLVGTGLDAAKDDGAYGKALKRLLSLTLALEFLAGVASFSLLVEIPAQVIAVPCAAAVGWGAARQQRSCAFTLASLYMTVLAIAAIAWGATRLVADWDESETELVWREPLMPIWLALVALAFVHFFALYVVYGSVYSRMRRSSAAGLSWKQRLAVFVRCGLRLRAIRTVAPRAGWLANEPGFVATWSVTNRILCHDRKQRAEDAAKALRLEANAGVRGTDSLGKQLDRREHVDTMKALRWLHACQMGHYRKHGARYSVDLGPIIDNLSEKYDLPDPVGVDMRIGPDGQSWYAARRTITGHWFAIGASGPPSDQWFYDGPTAPSGFPDESEWDQWLDGDNSPNWSYEFDPQDGLAAAQQAAMQSGGSATRTPAEASGFTNQRRRARQARRPSWCKHYDEWQRAYRESEELTARNGNATADWSQEDQLLLYELTNQYTAAAGRMWDEAPDSENWDSAHIKCTQCD